MAVAWQQASKIITCTDYGTDPATTNLGDCPPAPLSDGGLWPYPGAGGAGYPNADFYSGGGVAPNNYDADIFMKVVGSPWSTDTITLTPQGMWNGYTWWEGTQLQGESEIPVSVFVGNGASGFGTGDAGIWVSPLGSLEPSVYMNMACYGSDIPTTQCTQAPYLFQAADAGGPSQINPLYGGSPTAIIWDNIPTNLLVTASGPGGTMPATPPIILTRTVPAGVAAPGSALWQYWFGGLLEWQLDYGISVPYKWTLNGLFTKASAQGTPVSATGVNDYQGFRGNFSVQLGSA